MTLSEYNRKRNFSLTSEPKGKKSSKSAPMPIFSVQYHEARRTHFDLRLQFGGVLLSWAVPKGPSYDTTQRRLAVKVEDHPLDYAHFEGEIPKGQYGGGKVTLWDSGVYSRNVPFKSGLKEGSLKFTLYGKRLKGSWALVQMEGDNWLLIKEKDEFSQNPPDISDTSSILNIDNIANKNPFEKFELKQATATATIPTGDWIYEIKYDGYRISAICEDTVKLITRNGIDMTEKFSAVAAALKEVLGGKAAIIDGEMTAIKEGKTNFSALQHHSGELCYVAFDLLALDGEDLRPLPLYKRKEKLKKLLTGAPKSLAYSESFFDGEKLFESAKELCLEGIVCKKKNAAYYENDWLKVKCRLRQEFVICGYTSGAKEISSLLLGVYRNGVLEYAGSVGTGIKERDIKLLKEEFKGLETTKNSIQVRKKGVKWLKPSLMAEVEFAEWTSSNKVRQASYKGYRKDKSALNVKDENPYSIMGINITHPQRLIFDSPKISKFETARYYESVAQFMLPYLKGRPITVIRCNDGIENQFFKKHPVGEKNKLIYIDSPEEIIREVQLGTVEFHITCCAGDTNIMVFDLDPDLNLPLETVRQGALNLKRVLEDLSLKSFLKTSGGKGYHIVVPMPPQAPDRFTELAKGVALIMAQKFPSLYTANIKKNKRGGKIFIDWQRNTQGATAVAPFSLRARKGAPISAPIPWSKIDIPPDGITISDKITYDWTGFFDANK